MLTKLIRHEFRATSRIMWPIFAGMLALTLAMRASQNVLQNESPWLLNLLAVLVTIGFVFGIMALCFAPLVLSAVRFRDHLLKDEGYLTLTLPVNMHQLPCLQADRLGGLVRRGVPRRRAAVHDRRVRFQ